MSTQLTATFEVTSWDETAYDEPAEAPQLARASMTKAYSGALEGDAAAEVLTCRADPDDYAAGAGYVAMERVSGTLDGRTGTFVMQHGGTAGAGTEERSFGHIVPGSGTGALSGLRGRVEIAVTPEGEHTLTLEYDLA